LLISKDIEKNTKKESIKINFPNELRKRNSPTLTASIHKSKIIGDKFSEKISFCSSIDEKKEDEEGLTINNVVVFSFGGESNNL
jgi:YbbR domain-containing protein